MIYVIMHALHKSNHHRGSSVLLRGKSPRLKGDTNFLCPLSMSFFSMMNIHPANHRVQIWHFFGLIYIFRGLYAFSRHLAHINPIQLQLHGCDVRDVDCCSITAHPTCTCAICMAGFRQIITQHTIGSAHTVSRSDGDEPCAIMNEQNCKGSQISVVVCG